MENVSRALIIAAGVLISIIILSLFIVMYNRMSSISKTQEETLKQAQLQEFNAQYEAYNKKVMYGVDVISLSNKVIQNNLDNPKELIALYISEEPIAKIEILSNNNSEEGFVAQIISKSGSAVTITDFDKTVFKCTKIEYANTGKVNKIYLQYK